MTTTDIRSDQTTSGASTGTVDLKLEAVVIPVSDVDRAKQFYASLGWRLDADFAFDNGFRVVQFTPPGSGASVQFGTNITSATPGSAQGLYLVVSDIQAARDQLKARGAKVSEVFHPAATSFGSASDLASALRRAETAHGEHEKRTGEYDANWPDWYAAYMVAEQTGTELPV